MGLITKLVEKTGHEKPQKLTRKGRERLVRGRVQQGWE